MVRDFHLVGMIHSTIVIALGLVPHDGPLPNRLAQTPSTCPYGAVTLFGGDCKSPGLLNCIVLSVCSTSSRDGCIQEFNEELWLMTVRRSFLAKMMLNTGEVVQSVRQDLRSRCYSDRGGVGADQMTYFLLAWRSSGNCSKGNLILWTSFSLIF